MMNPRMESPTVLRLAVPSDVDAIAALWESGWRDVHLGRVPAVLAEHRDFRSFRRQATDRLTTTKLAIADGEPAGFVMTHVDEIDQLYVDTRFQGTGIATRLLRAGESRIAVDHARAWLAVVDGNARARRFYSRNGWRDTGPFIHQAWTIDGSPIGVPVRRYEKELQT